MTVMTSNQPQQQQSQSSIIDPMSSVRSVITIRAGSKGTSDMTSSTGGTCISAPATAAAAADAGRHGNALQQRADNTRSAVNIICPHQNVSRNRLSAIQINSLNCKTFLVTFGIFG